MSAYLAPGMQEFVDELRAANAPHPQTLPLAVVRQNMEDQAPDGHPNSPVCGHVKLPHLN